MGPFLPESHHRFLACPRCHARLRIAGEIARCEGCGGQYPRLRGCWRFGTLPDALPRRRVRRWARGQRRYERWSRRLPDDLATHLGEIESVREIYSEAFRLRGPVLDVGGHDGRLRHFLDAGTEYLVVDPFTDCVETLASRPNLLRAFPALRDPCPFVQGVAESLPIASGAFTTVHLRSVLDHLAAPRRALAEARRVLSPGGWLLVGLHVRGTAGGAASRLARTLPARALATWSRQGARATLRAVARRLSNPAAGSEHLWEPSYPELVAAVEDTGFTIERVHWQRLVASPVAYVMARPRPSVTSGTDRPPAVATTAAHSTP